MGNQWSGRDEKALFAAERQMLIYSGISLEHFESKNVVIDKVGNYIRTLQVGDVSTLK
jgi:hypothetical protein